MLRRTVTICTLLALLMAAFPPGVQGAEPISEACRSRVTAYRDWLLDAGSPSWPDVDAWMRELSEPCGFAWGTLREGVAVPMASGGVHCQGAGAGSISLHAVVAGVKMPLDRDLASGDFGRAGNSSWMNADGPVYGMSVGAESGFIRIGPLVVFGSGHVDTNCGAAASEACIKVLWWTFCSPIRTTVACSSTGTVESGMRGLVTVEAVAHLVNPINCSPPNQLHTLGERLPALDVE